MRRFLVATVWTAISAGTLHACGKPSSSPATPPNAPATHRRSVSPAYWPREVPLPRDQLDALLRQHVRPFDPGAESRIPASAAERLAVEPAYGAILWATPCTRDDWMRVEPQDVIRVAPDGTTSRGVLLKEACASGCERVTWISDEPTRHGRMVSIRHGRVTAGVARISTVLQCRLLATGEVAECLPLAVR